MDSRIHHIQANSSEETEKIAESLGAQLKGGEVIELIGDVGAGKTTFVRGLARGIGSPDKVSSPTFTVSKIYQAEQMNLRHYDFYRLDDYKIIEHELGEVISSGRDVAVLEWAENIRSSLPTDHIKVQIEVAGEISRKLTFEIPNKYNYIRLAE